jgi:hypothetical protein
MVDGFIEEQEIAPFDNQKRQSQAGSLPKAQAACRA